MYKFKTASGVDVPMIGLGTFPFQGEIMASVLKSAYRIGYRLIDTADDYRGESGIGLAISSGVFDRKDIFIQTKISNDTAFADEPLAGCFFTRYSSFMKRHSVSEIVREKVYNSLAEMKTDYLDSLLIHYPYYGYYEDIWAEMIRMRDEGLVRFIGVSNFRERHIEKLKAVGSIPDINELYISPIGTKNELINYCKINEICPMTYSPLMDIAKGRITEPDVCDLMKKYDKTLSQIILRWNVDRGCLPLAKSKNTMRLEENFNIFDFKLESEEVESINKLNQNYQILTESKICPGV